MVWIIFLYYIYIIFYLKCGCYISEVGNTSTDDQHFPCKIRKERRERACDMLRINAWVKCDTPVTGVKMRAVKSIAGKTHVGNINLATQGKTKGPQYKTMITDF